MDNDRELVIRALEGDQQAFAKLVDAYQSSVYNLAYRMLGDGGEAEDAAQEAFIRAYRHLNSYDTSRPFKTWLLSITSNHCIDRIRKRRLIWLSLDDILPIHPALASSEPDPEEAAVEHERSAMIQKMLAELSPEHRAVIVLHYWHAMSCAEIAETLGTTESTVKSRLFRARQSLAAQMQSQMGELKATAPAFSTAW
jgi:RNA polymerase sigma-70 factor (ECF subfamily)